jgi:chromatin structure-remodeling complex subunit RSC1/2
MEFDREMARLFEKGRRWYEPTSESYGQVLLLQVGGYLQPVYV